jgi:signal transduction histidine kinase/CheY-like chemotaxis protein
LSSPSSPIAPVERIKAVNHHLRVALDQVSEAVLILQNGLSPGEGPVIAWGNEAAVRCTGIAAHELFGSPLQPLLTARSWEALLAAMQDALTGVAGHCPLNFNAAEAHPMRGLIKVTRGSTGEILGVILTMTAAPVPEAPPEAPPETAPAAPQAVVKNQPTPSPEGWQEDVIETIRETARQVAHEFNNALTSIVLPVQLAIRAIPQNGDLFESLEVAHVSAQRASDLAKDFLDCFRPRSAVRSRCAPAALLGRSIRLATCAQPITSSLELEAALPEIEVDESQLERVIFNLIRNSVQAMPNGGRLRVSATQRQLSAGDKINLPDGPYIQISVRDWGPGIPDEYLQHLFHGRFTTKPDGNGCGLPICYQIIRDHGGEMLVRSRVNVGTEFLIYLPALPASFPQTSAFADPPTEAPASTAAPTQAMPAAPSAFPPQPTPAPASLPALQPQGMENRSAPAPVALAPLLPLTSLVPVRTAPVVPEIPAPAAATGLEETPHMWSKQPPGSVPLPNVPPVPAAPWQNTAATPAEAEPFPAEDSPPSLLVVDDEQGVRTALSQIAKVMGFDVSTVATSDEALQSYKDRLHASRPFSSVLLDLNLRGGLNGIEVFHAIRRMDPEALVVATSGQHAEGDVERFRALGFAGFLAKPYSLEHFDHVMRAALAS